MKRSCYEEELVRDRSEIMPVLKKGALKYFISTFRGVTKDFLAVEGVVVKYFMSNFLINFNATNCAVCHF